MTFQEVKKRIKERLPKAKNIRTKKTKNHVEIRFIYKGIHCLVEIFHDNKVFFAPQNKEGKKIEDILLSTNIKDVKEITKEIRRTATKLPKKSLKLKEAIEQDLSKISSGEIYNAGVNWKDFDYNKGLDELIKKDKDGYHIYYAGSDWKQFDYKKGLMH